MAARRAAAAKRQAKRLVVTTTMNAVMTMILPCVLLPLRLMKMPLP